jgi:hypothetical protein
LPITYFNFRVFDGDAAQHAVTKRINVGPSDVGPLGRCWSAERVKLGRYQH